MPETVRLTNIGALHAGDRVNLERTLRLCDGLTDISSAATSRAWA